MGSFTRVDWHFRLGSRTPSVAEAQLLRRSHGSARVAGGADQPLHTRASLQAACRRSMLNAEQEVQRSVPTTATPPGMGSARQRRVDQDEQRLCWHRALRLAVSPAAARRRPCTSSNARARRPTTSFNLALWRCASSRQGQHLARDPAEVSPRRWPAAGGQTTSGLFDVETESGAFCAGKSGG